jgi:predicted ArsR family transcriptional regulator
MTNKTQKIILDYISIKGNASAREISQYLNRTREDIQYHLKVMLAEGMIESLSKQAPSEQKKGRPEKFYILSHHRLQKISDRLLASLLSLFLENDKNEQRASQTLKDLALILHPPTQRQVSFTKLLTYAMHTLTKDGYRPTWEASKTGPVVFFNTCPYEHILEKHPALCQLDICILENLAGTSVQLIERYPVSKRTPPRCAFQLVSPEGILPGIKNR